MRGVDCVTARRPVSWCCSQSPNFKLIASGSVSTIRARIRCALVEAFRVPQGEGCDTEIR
jgi:hypothetical protein